MLIHSITVLFIHVVVFFGPVYREEWIKLENFAVNGSTCEP